MELRQRLEGGEVWRDGYPEVELAPSLVGSSGSQPDTIGGASLSEDMASRGRVDVDDEHISLTASNIREAEPETIQPHMSERHSSARSNSTPGAIAILVNLLALASVGTAVYLGWGRLRQAQANPVADDGGPPILERQDIDQTAAAISQSVTLLPLTTQPSFAGEGIVRIAQMDTIIPQRPRVEVITYTVQTGDSLFSIAEQFSLKPETLLWGNYEVLEDNPHLLKPGQVLNILPVDGTYYQWSEGDSLERVAVFFGVDVQAIVAFPGNQIDLTNLNSSNAGIEPGTWLMVQGGKRAIKDWGPPAISRSNPASARYYGSGHCGEIYEGAVGSGYFIWPTAERTVSGYTYDPAVHPAIDITGQIGNAVFSADSGVVVYAGWSNFGYGYLVVIDHGNGWQTAYAHLSAVSVGCGQSVLRGSVIGAVGSTGNSTGAHLHFELVYNGVKVNPLDYLQ